MFHARARLAGQPGRERQPVDRLAPLLGCQPLVRRHIDRGVVQRPRRPQGCTYRIHLAERSVEIERRHAAQREDLHPLVCIRALQVLRQLDRPAARVALDHHGLAVSSEGSHHFVTGVAYLISNFGKLRLGRQLAAGIGDMRQLVEQAALVAQQAQHARPRLAFHRRLPPRTLVGATQRQAAQIGAQVDQRKRLTRKPVAAQDRAAGLLSEAASALSCVPSSVRRIRCFGVLVYRWIELAVFRSGIPAANTRARSITDSALDWSRIPELHHRRHAWWWFCDGFLPPRPASNVIPNAR